MRIENRTIFIAEDDTEFDSEEACMDYERVGTIAKYLDNHRRVFIARDSSSTREIVTALLEKYDIQERKPS